MKLNGWQRLGVIASLGFVVVQTAECRRLERVDAEARSSGFSPSYASCRLQMDLDLDRELQKARAPELAREGLRIGADLLPFDQEHAIKWRVLSELDWDRRASECVKVAGTQLRKERPIWFWEWVIGTALAVPLGWLLVYLMIWVALWVRRGFEIVKDRP